MHNLLCCQNDFLAISVIILNSALNSSDKLVLETDENISEEYFHRYDSETNNAEYVDLSRNGRILARSHILTIDLFDVLFGLHEARLVCPQVLLMKNLIDFLLF